MAAILLAFTLGGGSDDVEGATAALQKQRRVADEAIDSMATDIYSGNFAERDAEDAMPGLPAQTDQEGKDKLLGRMALWTGTMAGVYALGQVHTPPKEEVDDDGVVVVTEQNFMWRLGNTVLHCADCLNLDGQVHTATEWRQSGIEPQSPDLACGGWNCDCRLIPTDLDSAGFTF